MEYVLFRMILMIFPILVYLVFTCYNLLKQKNIKRLVFVLTMCTSLYLSLKYNYEGKLLLFCNIPILICYFKKEKFLGIMLSLIVISNIYFKYDINIYVVSIKYFCYFMTYMFLYKKKKFKYLFLKISGVIQGFFVSFEYFMNNYGNLTILLEFISYVIVIYILTFLALYLFRLADDISNLYCTINSANEEKKLKNSLFKLTHEIKNPIAVCKGYLDMINIDDKIKSKKYISIIKSEIDRSLNVIADFVDYSKIKINKEIFDVIMLMDDIYESFVLLTKDKHIVFNYDYSEEEIFILGDYDRLKQVFVNIIKNSIESILNDGIINMVISLDNNFVKIVVIDNGIGMTKEELSNIKEMFYTTKRNGTGLGVALSNEIIEAHNGKMLYESEKNKGTKCIVKLPL